MKLSFSFVAAETFLSFVSVIKSPKLICSSHLLLAANFRYRDAAIDPLGRQG